MEFIPLVEGEDKYGHQQPSKTSWCSPSSQTKMQKNHQVFTHEKVTNQKKHGLPTNKIPIIPTHASHVWYK